MPESISLESQLQQLPGHLRQELLQIGIQLDDLEAEAMSSSPVALLITLVSESFDGHTYLDRELKSRPAVTRAVAAVGLSHATFVIDPVTVSERTSANADPQEGFSAAPEATLEDRIGRALWRIRSDAVRSALVNSGYRLENLDHPDCILATREGLNNEAIAIGFATSPKVQTVDLGIRRALESLRQARTIAKCYYVTPRDLSAPFANQLNARWLAVVTDIAFLHTLNASRRLAERLIVECTASLSNADPVHRGPVVDPEVLLVDDNRTEPSFLGFVDQWSGSDRARCLVVMAPAGHGKTTLSTELARRFADRFVRGDVGPVPLIVGFEAVRRVVDFEALVHKRLAELGAGEFGALSELLRQNHALLVVDGFDELADDAGMEVAESQVRALRGLLQGRAKVVLAGRSLFTREFAGHLPIRERMRALLGDVEVDVLEIRPFSEAQIETYVESRIGLVPARQRELLAFSRATADTASLCANPLFLRILSGLAGAGKLPTPERIAEGILAVIEKVCDREEERQHLGMGVAWQLQFLRWLARDMFRRGRASLPRQDVDTIAKLVVESDDKSLVSSATHWETAARLLDHALLSPRGQHELGFIHLYIRDVVIAQEILAELHQRSEEQWKAGRTTCADVRDLPEAAIRELASRRGEVLPLLSRPWLSEAGGLGSQERRNLLRVCLRAARYDEDNPRQWWTSSWLSKGVIWALDASNLVIEDVSFDGLLFRSCNLEGCFFVRCDFRGSDIHDCDLGGAVFFKCRGNGATRFSASTPAEVHVVDETGVWKRIAADQLAHALGAPAADAPRLPGSPAKRIYYLLQTVFGELVGIAGEEVKFHSVPRERLRPFGTDQEKEALEREIIPSVLKLCDRSYAGSSREVVEIDRRWRSSVVAFMRDGRPSGRLRDHIRGVVARASRYVV